MRNDGYHDHAATSHEYVGTIDPPGDGERWAWMVTREEYDLEREEEGDSVEIASGSADTEPEARSAMAAALEKARGKQ